MFARLPPSSSELTERKSVVPPSPPADRRREHRGSRLLRRRLPTRSVSPHASSARRRAIRCLIARSARCGSRWDAAYFVVARRREACRLTPPQHGGARSSASDDDGGGLQARCASSSKDRWVPQSTWVARSPARTATVSH